MTPETAVKTFIDRGLDPRMYRTGLAQAAECAVAEIDAVIAKLAPPMCTDRSGVADSLRHRTYGETEGRHQAEQMIAAENRADRDA